MLEVRLTFTDHNNYDPEPPMPPRFATVKVKDVLDIKATVQEAWPDERYTIARVEYEIKRGVIIDS